MTTSVQKIAEQVLALPEAEQRELFSWLADYQLDQTDAWDEQIAADSQPGGRLTSALQRARADIAQGRTKPLDDVLDDR